MKIGYVQILDMQMDALKKIECDKIFTDKMSGARSDRPGWFIFTILGGMPVFYFLFEWANEENASVALKKTIESPKLNLEGDISSPDKLAQTFSYYHKSQQSTEENINGEELPTETGE